MKWIALAVILCVIAFVAVRAVRSRSVPTFAILDEKMAWLAGEAVDMASREKVNLDFSTESIERVEELLAKLHDEYRTRGNEDGMNGLALAYGAYVGEAIRRSEAAAHWAEDSDIAGPGSYPIYWRDGASFPVAWCYKRMSDGPEENVWHKYQVLKQGSDLR